MATFLLDLDGTMYHGNRIIPSAKEFLDYLQKSGQEYYFLTNNASRTPQENALHMEKIGYQNIEARRFYNSAMACVSYAQKRVIGHRVMMIGQSGLADELYKAGYQLVEEGADMVMVGLNQEGNYRLYSQALQNLLQGAILLGTNEDRVLLSESGTKLGNGSIVKMLEYASGQTAICTGKPAAVFLEEALDYWGLDKEEVVMVGDNLETDILCGLNAKVTTVLVLGGVSNRNDCERLTIQPDHIVATLPNLANFHTNFHNLNTLI